MAELVVADAAFKTYPGGVIALRCTDWMGGARGTLTSGADAKASTGEAVVDTQQVTASILTDPNGAFAEAEDTLTIPFEDLPLEIDMTYALFLSLMIEGDWDPNDPEGTARASNALKFVNACRVAFYGDSELFLAENDHGTLYAHLRALDHYYLSHFGGSWAIGDVSIDKSEILHVRAYAQDGTSISISLDQLILIPFVGDGDTHGGEWRGGDFQRVGGQHNTFGFIGYDPPETGTGFVDGADGGDDDGKFTWLPFELSYKDQSGWMGADGGGDFQKKADGDDAEYMQRVVPDDFYSLFDTRPVPDVESNDAHCYVATGPMYRPAATVIEDLFTRSFNFPGPTVAGSGLGWTPEGYVWHAPGSAGPAFSDQYAYCDGSRGVLHIGGTTASGGMSANLGLGSGIWSSVTHFGAATALDEFTVSVKCRFEDNFGPIIDGGTTFIRAGFDVVPNVGSGSGFYRVVLDFLNGEWWLEGPLATVVHGPVSIPWFAVDVDAVIKLEIKRYRIRVKVWEDGTAEPDWAYDDFRALSAGGTYPYGDDLDDSSAVYGAHRFLISGGHLEAANQFDIAWDDFVVEYDPYGTREPTWLRFEMGDGTLVDEIEIPAGAQHLVYVGRDDFTDDDEFGDPYYLNFRTRVWSDEGAADLQMAKLLWAYFRSVHQDFTIVSMNWRSGDRRAFANRVLVGDR